MRILSAVIAWVLLPSCVNQKMSNLFNELVLSCGAEVQDGYQYVKIENYEGDGRAYILGSTDPDTGSIDASSPVSAMSLAITAQGCVAIPENIDPEHHIVIYDKNREFNGTKAFVQSYKSVALSDSQSNLEIQCSEKIYHNKRDVFIPITLQGSAKHFSIALEPQVPYQLSQEGLQLTLDDKEQAIDLKFKITNLQTEAVSSGQCQIVFDKTAPKLAFDEAGMERTLAEPDQAPIQVKPGDSVTFTLQDKNEASIYYCLKAGKKPCVYQAITGNIVTLPDSGEWELSAFATDKAENTSKIISLPIRVVNLDAIDSIIALSQTAKLQIQATDELAAFMSLKKAYVKYLSLKEDYERKMVEGPLYSAFWELGSKIQLQRVLEHEQKIYASDVGSQYIATASSDKEVFIWSKTEPKSLFSIKLSDTPNDIRLNKKGNLLAISHFESDMKIIDLVSRKEIASCPFSKAQFFAFEEHQIIYKPLFEEKIIVCDTAKKEVTAHYELEDVFAGIVALNQELYIANSNGKIFKGQLQSKDNKLEEVYSTDSIIAIYALDNKILIHNLDGLYLLDPAQDHSIIAEYSEPYSLNVSTDGKQVAINSGVIVSILNSSLDFDKEFYLENEDPYQLILQEEKVISIHGNGIELYDIAGSKQDQFNINQLFAKKIYNPIDRVLLDNGRLFIQEKNSSELHVYALSAAFKKANAGFYRIHKDIAINHEVLVKIGDKTIKAENRGKLIDYHIDESGSLLAILSEMDTITDEGEWLFGTGFQLYDIKKKKLIKDLNIGINGAKFIRIINNNVILFGFEGIQILKEEFPVSVATAANSYQIRQIKYAPAQDRVLSSDRNGLVAVYDQSFQPLGQYQLPSYGEAADLLINEQLLAANSAGQLSFFKIAAKEPFFEIPAHSKSSLLEHKKQIVFLGNDNRVHFLDTSNWTSQKSSFTLEAFQKADALDKLIVSLGYEKVSIFDKEHKYFTADAKSYLVADDKIILSDESYDTVLPLDFDLLMQQLCTFLIIGDQTNCQKGQ